MASSGDRRAIVAALLANLGIALAKFLGFLATRASSMLAESIHSLADSGNQALLLLGGARARRPADEEHHFGYGRERYFWSFIVAQVLFLLGGMFSLYEGIEKLRHPHELESPGWAIGILAVAVVLESLSFRTAIRESRPLKHDASWAEFIRRSKSPELPVVLLEDLGALVGLVLALVAVSLAAITGSSMWDGIGTVCIGALLLMIAVVLAIEMKSLLIGEAASDRDEAAMRAAIERHPSVRSLISLRTQHLSPDELLVAAKVEFDGTLTMRELADAIDEVEADIRRAVPAARRLFVEPDIRRAVASIGGDPT
ncbi:MAG: cation diffusion facilitator family transporter [Acidimicrobiales bacterium]